jgi:hypothetical protein
VKKYLPPLLGVALLVIPLWWHFFPPLPGGGVRRPGPFPAEKTPKQTAPRAAPFSRSGWGGEFKFTPLAHYQVYGKVMGADHYHFDWTSTIAPEDFCIVWGGLTEPKVLSQLKIRQDFRWCFWEYGENFPYDNGYIGRNMANTHIIPGSPAIGRAAGRVRVGDWVEMEGELVHVDGTVSGGTVNWTSSTSREDTGNGACEVMYVTSLHLRGREWQTELARLPEKPEAATAP